MRDFRSIYSHGFVRVAACTPVVSIGDPAANLAATLEQARDGHERGVALMVFPELGLSAYAIDDLLGQQALLDAVQAAIGKLVEASADLNPMLLVGAPIAREGRLFNCAVAVHRGRLLGVVPKTHLPNYREYYEKRWFASGRDSVGQEITVAGLTAPFGVDLLFEAEGIDGFVVHAEICEDLWAPSPPSDIGALAGATILCNLSASNITVGKAATRRQLCDVQSGRGWAAYVYAAAGAGESTTDLAWDGQCCIHELGACLAEGKRFSLDADMTVADVDVERLLLERLRTGTFNDAATVRGRPEDIFRRVRFRFEPPEGDIGLERAVDRFPFAPCDAGRLDEDCYETFNIQVHGLIRRLKATGIKRLTIGVSGGLDSTHALIVAARAFDLLGWPRTDILGFTLPGFATSEGTKANAWALMRQLGITAEEIDIRPLAEQMLQDLGHPFADGQPVYDVTFENVQAGLRTDLLFRAANQREALVLGTGDLSELALGWCTYGVGDQMSHYNVNGGVPKTLIQHVLRWAAAEGIFDAATSATLRSVLDTVISPELVPGEQLQSTEDKLGSYALHDFALHYVARYGLKPSKVAFLAHRAWSDAGAGTWPPGYPEDKRPAYDLATIRKTLETFLFRFFSTSQFKRSAMPNGPKVSAAGSLSPRGDWRAPSDGNARLWLDELRRNVPENETVETAAKSGSEGRPLVR